MKNISWCRMHDLPLNKEIEIVNYHCITTHVKHRVCANDLGEKYLVCMDGTDQHIIATEDHLFGILE